MDPVGPPSDLNGGRSGHVAVVGGQMHYVAWGDPAHPALVVLPKQGGWAAEWRHAAPLLARERHVIALDPPGYGDSRMGPPPYLSSIDETAAAMVAALDALGVERFAVAGASLGGGVALALAGRWREKVSRLIMMGAAHLGGAMSYAGMAERDQGGFYAPTDAEDRPLPVLEDGGYYKTPALRKEMNDSRFHTGVWIKPSSRGAQRADFGVYFDLIVCPTLLVYGEHGKFKENTPLLLERLKDVRMIELPGALSFAYEDEPALCAEAILAFLNEKRDV